MSRPLIIRHLIYDLDGTLVDSALDFDLMRHELGLPLGSPILETLATMPPHQARQCWEVVERHELAGAERAVLFSGVADFVKTMHENGVRQAVLTRNSRTVAESMLRLLPFRFDLVVTRDEAPTKPDPQTVRRIREFWGASPATTAIIGDSRFDMETGRRAGVYNVLYLRGRDSTTLDFASWAHLVIESFENASEFLAWLADPPGIGLD